MFFDSTNLFQKKIPQKWEIFKINEIVLVYRYNF